MVNLKRVPLKNACNCRDLGGIPTLDGRYVKWGLMYRSDAVSDLSAEDWELLRNRHVQVVIDLRTSMEQQMSPICIPDDMNYQHISIIRGIEDGDDGPELLKKIDDHSEEYGLDYSGVLLGSIVPLIAVLRAIIQTVRKGQAVLFMCSAGKDRTGIVAALVLYLCHVSREDIIADYMVSHNYIEKEIYRKMRKSLPEETYRSWEKNLGYTLHSDPETMIRLLDTMEQENVIELLCKKGFDLKEQQAFAELMTNMME